MHIALAVILLVAALFFLIAGLASVFKDLLERDSAECRDWDNDGTSHPLLPDSLDREAPNRLDRARHEVARDEVSSDERFADSRRT
jgi:hypothetical protein